MRADPIQLKTPRGEVVSNTLTTEDWNKLNSVLTDEYEKAFVYYNLKDSMYNIDNFKHCENGEFTIPINRIMSFPFEAKIANLLDGDVAEFGVANGATTILLSLLCPDKTIYAFDTFEGFTPLDDTFFKTSEDGKWTDDVPLWRDWGANFKWGRTLERLEAMHNVVIKKGIFPDTTKGMEDKKFSLVHIDVDIYGSTKVGLEYFWDRMVPGGVIVLDDFDYTGNHFPQVQSAVKEFFEEKLPGKPFSECVMQRTDRQGLIVKPFKVEVKDSDIVKQAIDEQDYEITASEATLEITENFQWNKDIKIRIKETEIDEK